MAAVLALAPPEADDFGRELDRIRAEVLAERGAEDARYIRTLITVHRAPRPGGRRTGRTGRLPATARLPCLLGNLTANVTRNIWAHTVIFCGHFPAGAETFTEDQIEDESRGQWYLRQAAGRSPVDRGKQGLKRSVATEARGVPLGLVSAGANRHDSPLLVPTPEAAKEQVVSREV
jgi:hypothetical protein